MTLLLDTHTFLWWLSKPGELSARAAQALGDPQNRVLVSILVLWEIAIKRSIGKLTAPIDLEHDVAKCGFELLPISIAHVLLAEQLPMHHRDPFDRMLIAQAIHEQAQLVSRDDHFPKYGVSVIKA